MSEQDSWRDVASEADVVDGRRLVDPGDEPSDDQDAEAAAADEELAYQADPADLAEQRRAVPDDGEDRPR
jgi:hypothetical protein